MIKFKGNQFEREIILWGVRWYVAYPISYRQLEEMMGERGVTVDHSTLNRWVIKYAPEFEKQFRRRQRPVGRSWRLDETYVKIKGKSAYLYRAVDKEGQTIDFLLTLTRDRDAAARHRAGEPAAECRDRVSQFAGEIDGRGGDDAVAAVVRLVDAPTEAGQAASLPLDAREQLG